MHDPTLAAADPALPSLALALDPTQAEELLARVPPLAGAGPLRAIRVVRHKAGRRCLVAYDLEGYGTVLGKVQRRRYGKSGLRLLTALRESGLDGSDGVAVPEPVGFVAPFRMWLQREAPGLPVTDALDAPGAGALAGRVAEAAHRLHGSAVPPEREHGIADELRILDDCLRRVAAERPRLATPLRRLLARCARADEQLADAPRCGIHRDFYADQVLVADDGLLTLLDFDLYCLGDPALDLGNFAGHVAEQALRTHGDADALRPVEDALQERFAELAGAEAAARVPLWTALTVARHVFLSTRFEARRHLTEELVGVTGARLTEAGL